MAERGRELYERARRLIPGGTQLLSKRPEMFLPEGWPSYFRSARGVEVTDLDGRVFIDMSIMGIGACVLGYADPDVDAATKKAIENGVACTLNAPEEVELAELLCSLHPWAEQVRYARSGGEALSMAVRIARASSRRDVVAFSGYHGWTDWYLAANLGETNALDGHLLPGLEPLGVPRALRDTAVPFHYNRFDELEAIVKKHPRAVGAIVMEPRRDEPPQPGFLEKVRALADDIGAVLIFDEVTSGFRMNCGGMHLSMGVQPDLAVFAKAMANGYAMSAVIGRSKVMEATQSTFISSTNWTERIGPTAAIATIKKFRANNVAAHLEQVGNIILLGWRKAGEKHGIGIHTGNLPALPHFRFTHVDELAMHTFFTQWMLDHGYLASGMFKPSYAHTEAHVRTYLEHVDQCFTLLSQALAKGDLQQKLRGPLQRRGFYRLTS